MTSATQPARPAPLAVTEDRVVAQVTGNNIRNCLAAARKALNVPRHPNYLVKTLSGGEDGLYRVTLINGMVVEITVKQHTECKVILNPDLNPTKTLRNV